MTLSEPLQLELVEFVAEAFEHAQAGHCVRVDHLRAEDGERICQLLSERLGEGAAVYVLAAGPVAQRDVELTAEQAVELRNRKRGKLCLFVPAGRGESAASSLGNAFSPLDLSACWQRCAERLAERLPPELRRCLASVRAQLRGDSRVADEQWADFVAAAVGASEPGSMGRELWRVGLIPDTGEDFDARLDSNRVVLRHLVRPVRAVTSAAERLAAAAVKPGLTRDRLMAFFSRQILRQSADWLQRLADDEYAGLRFEHWEFAKEDSELREIVVDPFTKGGELARDCGLKQEGGAGSRLYAQVGPKQKLKVRWQPDPKGPGDVHRWRVMLIPSREEYGEDASVGEELPELVKGAKTRTATIPMDFDISAITVRYLQVRITGLNEQGIEVQQQVDSDGRWQTVEGLSEEFQIEEGGEAEDAEPRAKQRPVRSLPLARLRAAMEVKQAALDETSRAFTERSPWLFAATYNGRVTGRLAISPVLRELEERVLADGSFTRWAAHLRTGDELTSDKIEPLAPPEALTSLPSFEKFAGSRQQVLRLITRQTGRGLVETAAWNDRLSEGARAQARAYLELLAACGDLGTRRQAMTLDTLRVTMDGHKRRDFAVLVLPTHPLRLLWYAAYADLLGLWERELLTRKPAERKRTLDLGLVEWIEPVNCPLWVPSTSGALNLLTHNLGLFWGVALPVDEPEPARRVAEIAAAVGLEDERLGMTTLTPAVLARALGQYVESHRYVRDLSVNAVNPGNGRFLADALSGLLGAERTDDDGENRPPRIERLEVLAHLHPPLPAGLPALAGLQRQLYEAPNRPKSHHLAPLASVSVRRVDQADRLPRQAVNVSVACDALRPAASLEEAGAPEANSSALFGLLIALHSSMESTDAGIRWRHHLALPDGVEGAKHPVASGYTGLLLDFHRRWQKAAATLVDASTSAPGPSVEVTLGAEAKRAMDLRHEQSDWVISLDRFLGPEYFDHPGDDRLRPNSSRYLLDYAPEFLEGLGHRLLVTTAHRVELIAVLQRALADLRLRADERTAALVLEHLKTVSGRLGLRLLASGAEPLHAVCLAAAVAWLRGRGELDDSVLVPVEAHREVLRAGPRSADEQDCCDLLLFRPRPRRSVLRLIQVAPHRAVSPFDEHCSRLLDRLDATRRGLEATLLNTRQPRIDLPLHRSRLVAILRFYAGRAERHGLAGDAESVRSAIAKLEHGIPELNLEQQLLLVDPAGAPQRKFQRRDTTVQFLCGQDLRATGIGPVDPDPEQLELPVVVEQPAETEALATAERSSAEAADQVEPAPTARPPETVAVELGLSVGDREPVSWRASVTGSPHLFIVGIPGQGKTVTMMRIACELADLGLPALIVDFHGQFGNPDGPYRQRTAATVLHVRDGLPFSPFEAQAGRGTDAGAWRVNAERLAEIFAHVCGLGEIQKGIVYEALRDCYQRLGFEDGQPERLPSISELSAGLEAHAKGRREQNVVARCRPLLEHGLFRDDLGAEPLDLLAASRQGLVLGVDQVDLEAVQNAAGAFLLRKLYKDMFHWGETDRLRLVVMLDEAHRLVKDVTLPKLMKEGRKYGIAILAASQNVADFHQEVLTNAGTKVVFRTNHPDSKLVAAFLGSQTQPQRSTDLKTEVENLAVGQAYVKTADTQRAQRVAMHPLQSG